MSDLFKLAGRRLLACFLAGVLAILPLVITVAVVIWVVGFVGQIIGRNTLLGDQLENLGGWTYTDNSTAAYAIGWVMVLGVVFVLGVLVQMGAKQLLQGLADMLLHKIPLIGSIYGTSKQLVGMLDKKDEADVKGMSVVFCLFGQQHGAGLLGLLVSPERFRINDRDYHIVIIPTAPVPVGGALLFVPAESVIKADMSVDGLMSIYVSMGVTAGDFMPPEKSGSGTQ